ncbi:hypothetical protein [Bacillus sp. ISL-55]|uniref:hypothetical protein n=1 Tax=Bacillus sp. ISL-55 TaxID=2819134 RepID=UPI001BE58CF5|nr:hypothetical protein [Bacillus sp. ISL-55]MBT2692985.1 hypothetical protein [Bacillus sp. ISL-55]
MILKKPIVFLHLLIVVEGAKTPTGSWGRGRPRRSETTRRLPGPPVESEAHGTKINSLVYSTNTPVHKSDKTHENSVIYITEWELLEMV